MEEHNNQTNNTPPVEGKKLDKKYIYVAVAVVGVTLVSYLVFRNREPLPSGENMPLIDQPAEQISLPTSTTSTTSAKPKPTAMSPKTQTPLNATQKYLDALKIYKNSGYYFQFVDCHGLPGKLTMKKGKKFMLDNRDNKSRKIAIVGGQSYKIGAYGFAIATAPSRPGTYYITCDGGGAASILVQQ